MFSAVIEPLGLILRFTAHPDTQTLEDFQILLADDDGEVGLTVPETGQLPLGKVRQRVGQGGDCQGQQYLVGVESGVTVIQIGGFQMADRL